MATTEASRLPPVQDFIRFEDGEMEEEELVEFFQKLIDTGDAWRLQGFYGRTATALIERGLCHKAEAGKTFVLKMVSYCGMSRTLCEGTMNDCMSVVKLHIKRHKKKGGTIGKQEGNKWELQTPENAAMISDDDGYLEIEHAKD